MKIAHKGKFFLGLTMLIGFFAVVVLILMPGLAGNGKNVLNLFDDLYNSVSKSSGDFMAEEAKTAEEQNGQQVSMTVKGTDANMAQQIATIMTKSGATSAEVKDKSVKVKGDLGVILTSAVDDSTVMYANNGAEVAAKYGINEKEVMNDWWNAFNSGQKDLTAQEQFEQSKTLREIQEKAVEPAYNYYGVEAQSASEKWAAIAGSLGGYILYTLWYGFALLFMFEGWGLKLSH